MRCLADMRRGLGVPAGLVALCLLVAAPRPGGAEPGPPGQPSEQDLSSQTAALRDAIQRAQTAEQAGRLEESLRRLDSAMLRHPGVSWRHLPAISLKKADLLARLGRSGEALALLESIAGGDRVPAAVRQRAAAAAQRIGSLARERGALRWVPVPGGSYEMGSEAGDLAAAVNERPRHTVSIAPLEVLHSEVTVRAYEACVKAGRCTPPAESMPACNWAQEGRGDHPVNCVTWEQAAAFCASADGRLPSEAEWEYVARAAGGARPFPWGAERPDCQRAVMSEGGTESAGCGALRTWPVCSKSAGDLRLGGARVCDLAGNVTEWVSDCWHRTYDGALADGAPWTTSCVGVVRATRGGSLYSPAADLRATGRSADFPGAGYDYVGFRCVRAAKRRPTQN